MTPEMNSKIKISLIEHEGYASHPYVDTVGKVTIGVGYNLTDRGVSDEWIKSQLEKDIAYFYTKLSDFWWFRDLNEDRQIVLIDMAYNLGLNNFLEFKQMIAALELGYYEIAADQMLNSNWSQQVGNRAKDLANGMRKGIYNVRNRD